MFKKLYEESSIQDIANAIRSKNGSTNTYKVSEMATAINDISVGSSDAVLYTPQTLTDTQKLQARTNIGASDFSGSYSDLTDQPTIPSTQDVADAVIADGIQATLGNLPSATLPAVLETFIDAFEDGVGNYIPVSTSNNNWNPKKLIIAYTGDASELTGYIPTTDWINGFLTAALAKKLDKTGGTLTGNLTGKYITGTWLQTTAATDLNKTPPKIAVLDASGWVYYRTLDELKTDLGVTSSGSGSSDAVLYTPQTLTDTQKLQARTNIGASDFSGSYSDLTDQPTIPSTQDVADAVIADGIQATLGNLPSATLPAVLETFIDAFEDGVGNYIPVSTSNNNWNPKKLIIAYTGDASELTGYIPTTDWINGFLTAALAKKLDKTGGTLTGNLTGKYITGTWLQTTAATDLNKTPPKIAVLDASGLVYYRTLDELKTDLGVTSSGSGSTTAASGMKKMQYIAGYIGVPAVDIPTNGMIYVSIADGGDYSGGDPQTWTGTITIENGTIAGGGDNVLNITSMGVTKANNISQIDIGIAFVSLTADSYTGVYQVISE